MSLALIYEIKQNECIKSKILSGSYAFISYAENCQSCTHITAATH